ncbi:IS66 family transposase [Mesorhizobium sp. NZP2298]|uniref:IS66 family transposase n=1 Tax=Mesorhizobium sp. NZP2298 TaxID=2483403 RepID=UPI0015550C40
MGVETSSLNADFFARIALLGAAVSARDITIAQRDEQLRRERAEAALRIQRLQLQIDRFNRKAFGRSSEKLGQMRLELEDLETDFAASGPISSCPSSLTPTRCGCCRCASSTPTCRARGSFASRCPVVPALQEAGTSTGVVRNLQVGVPILGLCLGYQRIGSVSASVSARTSPMHGRYPHTAMALSTLRSFRLERPLFSV